MGAVNWQIVTIVGFLVAGLAAVTVVVLFFVLHIRSVIGDLSGRTVAREIKAMRETNERSGDKSLRVGGVNPARGKLTEKSTEKSTEPRAGLAGRSVVPDTDELAATDRLGKGARATTKLQSNDTALLQSGGTTLLQPNTDMLSRPQGTTILSESESKSAERTGVLFRIKRSIVEIHTEEQISD